MLQSSPPLALDVFVPPVAPLVLLLFLGSGFLIFCACVAAALAAGAGRPGLARWLSAGALMVGVGYGVLLLAASFVSRERTLRLGEKKYFCEMDCHLAYDVESVSVPAGEGGRRVVAVRVWFDPSTTAPFRGNAPLTPNPRTVYLMDEEGGRYFANNAAALTKALRPGESFVTTFAFDVPLKARALRLFLGDPPGLESLIVNHENSPFHAKTYFELPPPPATQAGAHS